MRMDPSIILSGRPVNALGALSAGTQAGVQAGEAQQRGNVLSLYREQGPAIMQGDPNAMNALASIAGPQEALGVQQTQQALRINEENLELARAEGARAAQRFQMEMDANELAQEVGQIRQYLPRAQSFIDGAMSGEIDERTALMGLNEIFSLSPDLPAANSIEEAAITVAGFDGFVDQVDGGRALMGQGAASPPEVTNVDGVLYQYDESDPQGTLTAITDPRERGPDTQVIVNDGQSSLYGDPPTDHVWLMDQNGEHVMEPDPSGRGFVPVAVPVFGGPEDNANEFTAQRAVNAISTIDRIVQSENLEDVTGLIRGRIPARTQAQQDLLVEMEQVSGEAFLQAFESLKGGGQITENEGAAARAAIARLDRAQSAEAYRSAIMELRGLLEIAVRRAGGEDVPEFGGSPGAFSVTGGQSQAATPETLSEDAMRFLEID